MVETMGFELKYYSFKRNQNPVFSGVFGFGLFFSVSNFTA